MPRFISRALFLTPKQVLGAILAGLLYGCGFCGVGYWGLSWIAFFPLFWLISERRVSGRTAMVLGWVMGATAHSIGFSWVIYLLMKFAQLEHAFVPWLGSFWGFWAGFAVALFIFFVLIVGQSSLFAAFSWGLYRLVHKHQFSLLWAAPLLWIVLEWLWPALFPSNFSNSQYQWRLWTQSLDVVGPYGLSGLMVLVQSCCFVLLKDGLSGQGIRRPVSLAVCCMLVAANLHYGQWALEFYRIDTETHPDAVNVGIVQANIGMFEKHQDRFGGLRKHQTLSQQLALQSNLDLITWPESAFNMFINERSRSLNRHVHQGVQVPFIIGGLRCEQCRGTLDGTRRNFNTAVGTHADGTIAGTYDKIELLAFGEYIPGYDWLPAWLTDAIPAGRFQKGAHQRPIEIGGVRYGVLICYEDVLPKLVRRSMRENPEVFVNLTNDSWYNAPEGVWYGNQIEAEIHLALASFRSIEQRRFMVRAVNSGISAFISPTGEIEHRTPLLEQATAVGKVVPMYHMTWYAHFGDWLVWLSVLVMLGYAAGRAWWIAR